MTADREELVAQLVPIAARLVGAVRDYGPEEIAAVLARVPDGRHDALAVVLAAMVDSTRTPQQLLAWVDASTQPEYWRLIAAGVSPDVAQECAARRWSA